MKGIIIFFKDKNAEFAQKKVFDGFNALELSENWAKSLNIEYFYLNSLSLADFLHEADTIAQKKSADFVIFSYCDLPFLNVELTEKLIKSHTEYKCEYTFADGFPYGFAPEIIDRGTLKILEQTVEKNGTQKELGEQPFSRDAVFNLIKTDINAFEVNSVLSSVDWRLFRFAFHCGFKENFLQCENLFKKIKECNKSCKKENKIDFCDFDAEEISRIASFTPGCLKTVPAFYDIQICDKAKTDSIYSPYFGEYKKINGISAEQSEKIMSFENFSDLLQKISDFSDNAVISLSAWGEPSEHPDLLKMIEKVLSFEKFSVFLETDGIKISKEFCENLKNIINAAANRKNLQQKVMICVKIDAFSAEMYKKIHPNACDDDFQKVLSSVKMLCEAVPLCVYPQFVRMNENEDELENFFRFWNEKHNASGGKFVIQKYENFCSLLPERKPADLSPLERNVCWHLRRDFCILTNGDVTFCKQCVFSNIIGNVFKQSLEEIWKKTDETLFMHINHKYPLKCEKCDEFYTYNF